MKITEKLTPVLLLVSFATILQGADVLLRDRDFQSAGQPDSAWQVAVGKGGGLEPATAADGQTPARQLKATALTQPVTLPAGLFELTVQARGQGELVLAVSSAGERTQMLGKDWGLYGLLFETAAGERTVTIRVAGEGTLMGAAIRPATDEQQAAWEREQKSVAQFGFVTVSAQRPSPGSAPLQFAGDIKPLAAMRKFAVLDEPRLNTSSADHVDRLVQWLGDNGFERLDGVKLPEWMAERIQRGDAYGSVVVLPRGVSPAGLFDGPDDNKPLWLEYIRSGGRIVHIGNVPLGAAESPVVQPVTVDTEKRSVGILGLQHSWNSPYCGQGGLPVTATAAARQWGLETADGSIIGMPLDNVSLAFHVFTVPKLGKQGASDWFRNVRPDLPWSGLVKLMHGFNGNSDACLRDVWRAAHYVGQPVVVPPIPPVVVAAPPKLRIVTVAGGLTNRHEFVRGEQVQLTVKCDAGLKADWIRTDLRAVRGSPDPARSRTEGLPLVSVHGDLRSGPGAGSGDPRPTSNGMNFTLDTAPYADGEYRLTATALAGSNPVASATETIGIRYLPPENFGFEIGYSAGTNLRRTDLELADIHDTGLELYLGLEPAAVEAAVRHQVGFSFRCMPNTDKVGDKTVTFEQNPEYYRFGPDGKPLAVAGYSGGRPSLGLSHPAIRAAAARTMEQGVKSVAGLPSFRPYVLCNDDFSCWYGWDYAPPVLAAFKTDTGLDAPRAMIKPAKPGAISDNNPWVKWNEWTLVNVVGAYNKAETAGALQARPDVRVGPIPGGSAVPLVSMWDANQYPPYNFGKNGFNLICSYYYNGYWQPVMTDTFWMEIGRMGNRDLPEWCMPYAGYPAGFTRNNFYHFLAGGVRGLAYFMYPVRTPSSWPEFRRLGQVVRRLGPVQMRLEPAQRDLGLLNSFTSNCFDPGHTLIQVYAYHNLMQAHFSVEPVSEDEILAGRANQYQAIVLYNIQYLRQSVYDALVQHAAHGGRVILDTSVPFDIPGAKRLNVDLGMGTQHTLPFPPEGAHVSTPGRKDYGRADRIELIKKALAVYVKPQFDSADIRLVASPFAAAGVPYTWFVNAQNQQEYAQCCDWLVGYPKPVTAQSTQAAIDWENAETAKGPYTSTLTMDQLPGVPYDLLSGKKLPVTKTADGRFALTVSMVRFGGTLVAWLPEDIASLELQGPRTARPGKTLKASATLHGRGGFLGLFAGRRIPGALPVEFTLKDPHGKEQVMSGVRATQDGVATWEWTPAVNDLAGEWTLTATDLASGRTVRQQILLRR